MTSTDPYVFPSATTPNTNPCSKIPPGLLTYRHDPADRGDPCQPIDQGAQLADSKNFRAAGSGGHPAHYSTIPLQAVLAFAFAESHTPLITHSRPPLQSLIVQRFTINMHQAPLLGITTAFGPC
jgi:hypothetical protein